MNLRKQLSSYIALNNYVEAFRENTSSIVLTDAITNGLTDLQLKGSEVKNKPEMFLDSVVAKGGTEQNGTPTPDTPMDIVSNNGVLKVRHQSGLPLGYTLLDYVESSGTQYINTGVVLGQDYTNTNIKLEYDALINHSANWQVCGTLGINGIYIGVNSSDIIYYGTGFSDTSTGVTNPFVKCKYINDAKNGVIKVTNLSTNTDIVNLTYTPVTKTTVLPIILFSFSTNATAISSNKMSGKMYNAKIYNNNELIRHFIPAKRLSDSVIGMYDTVSGTFFTNQGTGEFIAGNPVNDFEVYTDGTVETIKDSLNNTATAEMLLKVGDYQDEQEILSGDVTRKIGVKVFDGTETFFITNAIFTYFISDKLSGKNTVLCSHFKYSTQISSQVEDMKIITFNSANVGIRYDACANTTAFKQFLADQYAAGTPVIVIYPLNASTTETVSPQKLFKNPVTVTEASIDNLEVTTTEAEHTVPTPDYPLDIVSNNGVLKVSPNLFDKNSSYALYNGYINNKNVGENTTLMAYSGGDKTIIIKVAPNTTYTVTRVTNLGSVYDRIRCAAFTTLPSDGSTGVILCNYMNTTQANATFTTLSDTQYVAINVRNSGAVGDDWTQFVDAFQLEQGSTATQYRPYGQIYTDGTPETITITGKNLFNESHIKSVAISNTSVVIPVKQNKTYTWSYNKTEYDFRFDSDFVWGIDLNGSKVENGVTLVYANGTYTTASYVTVTVVSPNVVALQTVFRDNTIQPTKENVLASSMQLEEGIRPTKYEEYYQVSFAPEDLLKLSDYQDVQSVLDGIVTRNVGVKVLDGTENWTRYGTGKFATPLIGSKKQDSQEAPFATHFVGTSHNNVPVKDGYVSVFNGSIAPTSGALGINYQATPEVEQFKQWLASEYAAGTPVIVVYPLANTVEETVESRDVFITSGTNTIERNSEYVSSGDITVKYKKLR